MSWIVIIDNGQEYSDHDHQTVLACATEAEASTAVDAFNSWVKRIADERDRRDDGNEQTHTWGPEWAPPFWFSHSPIEGYLPYGIRDYSASCIQVPAWAETCP